MVAEMKMIKRFSGHTMKYKIRNKVIRYKVGVVPIADKMREARPLSYSSMNSLQISFAFSRIWYIVHNTVERFSLNSSIWVTSYVLVLVPRTETYRDLCDIEQELDG